MKPNAPVPAATCAWAVSCRLSLVGLLLLMLLQKRRPSLLLQLVHFLPNLFIDLWVGRRHNRLVHTRLTRLEGSGLRNQLGRHVFWTNVAEQLTGTVQQSEYIQQQTRPLPISTYTSSLARLARSRSSGASNHVLSTAAGSLLLPVKQPISVNNSTTFCKWFNRTFGRLRACQVVVGSERQANPSRWSSRA